MRNWQKLNRSRTVYVEHLTARTFLFKSYVKKVFTWCNRTRSSWMSSRNWTHNMRRQYFNWKESKREFVITKLGTVRSIVKSQRLRGSSTSCQVKTSHWRTSSSPMKIRTPVSLMTCKRNKVKLIIWSIFMVKSMRKSKILFKILLSWNIKTKKASKKPNTKWISSKWKTTNSPKLILLLVNYQIILGKI